MGDLSACRRITYFVYCMCLCWLCCVCCVNGRSCGSVWTLWRSCAMCGWWDWVTLKNVRTFYKIRCKIFLLHTFIAYFFIDYLLKVCINQCLIYFVVWCIESKEEEAHPTPIQEKPPQGVVTLSHIRNIQKGPLIHVKSKDVHKIHPILHHHSSTR